MTGMCREAETAGIAVRSVGATMPEEEPWRKYQVYAIAVDTEQNDLATEIKLCSFARPHMRAFHCAWYGFFVAFFSWFAVTPLLGEIRTSLGLSNEQIWTSSISGVAGTIVMRFLLGPLCDKYGARTLFGLVLIVASIPTACVGLIDTAAGLCVIRLFIGIAGGSFVACQYWTSTMFSKPLIGTVNGIVAGWGNLGGGVAQIVVGAALFPLFKNFFFDGDAELAWRTVCIVPAIVAFATGIVIYCISDDCPKGNYDELKRHGCRPEISVAASFRSAAVNPNSWILFTQYGCCFGVELTMYNAAALYFTDRFGQSTEHAAAIASVFGWMNLFARGLGGFISDKASARAGMRGRLFLQAALLALEGSFVIVFARAESLAGSIAVMALFSFLAQAGNGSTFGIVPYIDPDNTGSVAGIVGAGGSVGAVCFGLGFRQLDYHRALLVMGFVVIASSILSLFLIVEGHRGLLSDGTQVVSCRCPGLSSRHSEKDPESPRP